MRTVLSFNATGLGTVAGVSEAIYSCRFFWYTFCMIRCARSGPWSNLDPQFSVGMVAYWSQLPRQACQRLWFPICYSEQYVGSNFQVHRRGLLWWPLTPTRYTSLKQSVSYSRRDIAWFHVLEDRLGYLHFQFRKFCIITMGEDVTGLKIYSKEMDNQWSIPIKEKKRSVSLEFVQHRHW